MAGENEQEDGEFIELPEEEEAEGGAKTGKGTPGASKADTQSQAADGAQGDGKAGDADDDPDEEDDDPSSGDKTAVEASDKQERRRLEKQQQRLRRKAAIERTQREIKDLRELTNRQSQQIAQLLQRGNSVDAYNLRQQMNDTALKYKRAEDRLAHAIKTSDGDGAKQAIAERDDLANHMRQLSLLDRRMRAGGQVSDGQTRQPQPQPAPKADPAMAKQYNSWRGRNSWFDPELADRDSKIVYVLDEDLEAEGYDPKTSEYWEELDRRIGEVMPHRATDGVNNTLKRGNNQQNGTRKGPPVGAPTQSGKQAPGSKKSGMFVSAARKQAMIEAGIWDDPVRRNKQLRAYQKYDREHAQK